MNWEGKNVEAPFDANNELQKAIQYHQSGQFQMAEAIYRKILEVNPNNADALHFLGVIAHQMGRHETAVDFMNRAIRISPDVPYYYNNIGGALISQNKLEEASSCYQKAVQLKPDYVEAHYNLGIVLGNQGRLKEAESSYRKAVQLKPDYVEAYNNLGNVLRTQGRAEEAAFYYKKAIQLRPDYAEAYNNLGNVLLQHQGRAVEAVNCYQEAVRLKPDYMEAYSNYLMAMHYDGSVDRETITEEAVRWGEKYCFPLYHDQTFHNRADIERRFKVGYVSADFRRHPIGYFIETVLTHHNREKFEIFCYSNNNDHDDMTRKLQLLPHNWRNIAGLSDDKAHKMIAGDGIDILIDLSGHSPGNRLTLFARKPAPIQATWIGYFGTTGINTMDYIIADRYVIPEEDEKYYVEKVARFPYSYLCYTPFEGAPEINELPFLSRGYITFGCFNNIAKVNPAVVTLWSKILEHVPGSRLCLKTPGQVASAAKEEYLKIFMSNGIKQERIDMLEKSAYQEYLAYYGNIDIVLDTFPFAGNTTTFDALWMGVPVLTFVHNSFAGRFGLSILSTLGLKEFIAFTQGDYIKKVLDLTRNIEKLSCFRLGLRNTMSASPLCNGRSFVMNLENMYHKAWRTWCEKTK